MTTTPMRRCAAASASRGPGDTAASTSPTSMGWCRRIPGRFPLTSIRSGLTTGHQVLLSTFGRSEYWLQDWLAADLSRLGLGPLTLVHQELTQSGGGNLDLL